MTDELQPVNERMNEPVNERCDEPSDDRGKSRTRGLTRGNPNALTREKKRRILERCALWKFADPEYREPRTIKALAKECGVSADTIYATMSRLPNTLAEYKKLRRENTLAHMREKIERLTNKAKRKKPTVREARQLLKSVGLLGGEGDKDC
jgi:hypothetical protein